MPMDSADIAQEITETYLENLVKNHSVKALPFSGKCLCCKEPVVQRRFCDTHCREEFEARLRRNRIEARPPLV